jgi:hypothetical protein
MTLLFIDSFDHYNVVGPTGLQTKWDTSTQGAGTLSTNTTVTRGGGNSMFSDTESNTKNSFSLTVAETNELIAGGAFRFDVKSEDTAIVDFQKSGGSRGTVVRLDNGRIAVYRFQTLVASDDSNNFTLKPNTWYYIETYVKGGNAGIVDIRVNGKQRFYSSGIDISDGDDLIDTVQFGTWSVGEEVDTYFDDIYVLNKSGVVNNDFLGDVRVSALLPNANGNSSQFIGSDGNSTNNYQLVNENPFNSGTYVETSGANNIDLYGFDNLPAAATNIKAIQTMSFATKTDTGALTGISAIRTNGVNYFSGQYEPSSSGNPAFFRQVWEENPNTASSWSQSEINSLEAGFRLEG